MKIFKESLNSKGMTLIEVLASIVILGIILTAFFSFFSQSIMISGKVEDNLSAVNIADKILYKAEKNFNKQNTISTCTNMTNVSNGNLGISADDYTVNNKNYYPQISICKEAVTDLYQVHVEMYADLAKTILLTELFGYIQ